jgi:isocitrate dehydrogenase
MACHNYDGDMLTDEVAQIHRYQSITHGHHSTPFHL